MKKKIIYIVGIIILLLVIATIFILLNNNKKEIGTTNTTSTGGIENEFNIPETTGDIKTLYIVHDFWSGTRDENNYNKKIEKYDIEKGKNYKIDEHSVSGFKLNEETNEYEEYEAVEARIEFVITDVTSNSITIATTTPWSDSEGGIDLLTKKMNFTVSREKELKLTSPTTDGGDIYYFYVR